MAINPFDTIDYLEQARSRYTEQFKYDPETKEGAVVFDAYVQLLTAGQTDLQEVFRQLMQERSLDTAVGVNLDNIGEIVGQPRLLVNVDVFEFFGFKGVPNAGGFGTIPNPSVGAIFWSSANPRFGNIELSDELYRIFIRARIAKNATKATPEDIIRFADYIFQTTGSNIQYEGKAAYTLMIGRELTAFERSILNYVDRSGPYPFNLMPKPTGVKVNYGNFDSSNFFGFLEYPGAKGFGTYTYPSYDGSYQYDGTLKYGPQLLDGVGGKLASLIS